MNIPKKYLTEKVILIESRVDNNSILRILTQDKQINKTDPNYNYYKKLADWANINQNKTGPIDLSTITLSNDSLITNNKLSKNTNHLGSTLSQLKNLMDQEGKYDSSSAKSNLIQKTTLEILAGVSGIKGNIVPTEAPKEEPEEEQKEEPSEDSAEAKPELYQGMDWTAEKEKRLANPGDKTTSEILEKFYNDYYKIEYAGLGSPDEEDTSGIVDKLKSLDSILVQEFNKLGYNPAVNPFAQFLKNLINLKKEKIFIFDKLNTNNYGAIHNSFIKKYITGNMLGNYSSENILFCSDLYKHKGLTIVNYLSLQKQILDASENDTTYSTIKNLVARIFIQQNESVGISYEQKVKELLSPEKNIVSPGQPDAKLRPITEISDLYRRLFKSVAKKDVTDKVAEEILTEARKRDIVLSMIRYILDREEFTDRFIDKAREIEEWLKTTKYARNAAKISESKKVLSAYMLNAKADHSIISLLYAYAKSVLKNEKDKAKN